MFPRGLVKTHAAVGQSVIFQECCAQFAMETKVVKTHAAVGQSVIFQENCAQRAIYFVPVAVVAYVDAVVKRFEATVHVA